jgi:transposase
VAACPSETLGRESGGKRDRSDRAIRPAIEENWNAVENAVEQVWSNGPTEGHINRLKTLKRRMYGRAGLELLRARL